MKNLIVMTLAMLIAAPPRLPERLTTSSRIATSSAA